MSAPSEKSPRGGGAQYLHPVGVAGTTSEPATVLRTLVVAGRLFTLTDDGLHAYDLDTFAPGPVAPF